MLSWLELGLFIIRYGFILLFYGREQNSIFLEAVSYAYKRETLSRRMGRHFSFLFFKKQNKKYSSLEKEGIARKSEWVRVRRGKERERKQLNINNICLGLSSFCWLAKNQLFFVHLSKQLLNCFWLVWAWIISG